MKDKVDIILDDLKYLLEESTKKEDYEFCTVLKQKIELFQKFMNDEIEYQEIESHVLGVCMDRHDLLKLVNEKGDRYALFSVLGVWILFWIDNVRDNSKMWKDLIKLQKEQDRKIMEHVQKCIKK